MSRQHVTLNDCVHRHFNSDGEFKVELMQVEASNSWPKHLVQRCEGCFVSQYVKYCAASLGLKTGAVLPTLANCREGSR